ncbi:FHA domain-containing protein [Prochlorothrix hollandica]|uniref:FHA domain-containing protein n=1 Tax=Prochlorothrix hollandica TaxID=1223 RepID=UPI003340A4B7
MAESPVSILVVEDPQGVRSYKLDKAIYVIGRSPMANIMIQGRTCSRKHSTLIQSKAVFSDGGASHLSYKLFDGDVQTKTPSANGTLVNGSPIESQVLKHQDMIYFGADARATFLQVSRDLIPDDARSLQTLVIELERKLGHQYSNMCYVEPSGEVVVTRSRS